MTTGWRAIEPLDTSCSVALCESPWGGPVVRLAAAGGMAEVALQGAQVLSWQPRGHAPVIWMSPMERLAAPADRPKAVRGGTPVCWPWFAQHPTDASKPAHGFVRTRLWQVAGTESRDGAVRVHLTTRTTAADAALWPHQAQADIVITLDDGLGMTLTTTNLGPSAFALTQALHTYFAVGDITDVAVEGFDGLPYIDKLDGGAIKSQVGTIGFSSEVDRIYDRHPGRAVILDRGLKRRIEIEKQGSRSTVVWNPWVDKASRLGDMGPEGWRRMICVETCNAGSDIVQLSSGERHAMMARYRICSI